MPGLEPGRSEEPASLSRSCLPNSNTRTCTSLSTIPSPARDVYANLALREAAIFSEGGPARGRGSRPPALDGGALVPYVPCGSGHDSVAKLPPSLYKEKSDPKVLAEGFEPPCPREADGVYSHLRLTVFA